MGDRHEESGLKVTFRCNAFSSCPQVVQDGPITADEIQVGKEGLPVRAQVLDTQAD